MHFTLGLVSTLLLSLFSPIFASPIDPSDSLPTKTTGNGDPSRTWGASGAAGSYFCISPREHPDWAGPINFIDCRAALDDIENSIFRDRDKVWTFWSQKYRSVPPPQSFLLPWGATRGKPFSQSLSAFDPFHSLVMTHSRQLFIGHAHRSGLRKSCVTTR